MTPLAYYVHHTMTKTAAQCVRDFISEAEMEVWKLAAEGLSIKEIAAKRNRSVKTIESQWESLRKKLGARGFADVTRAAIEFGIIKVEVRV